MSRQEKYNFLNKMAISKFDPTKEGAVPFDPTQQGASPVADGQQPIESKIAKTGLFDIPVVGGLLRNAESSTESFGRMAGGAAYEGVRAGASALGDKNAYNPQMHQDPFLSGEDLQKFSDPVSGMKEGVGRTANFAGNVAALDGIPGLAKGVMSAPGKLGDILKLATKGGAVQAQKTAVKKGADIAFNDFAGDVLNKVGDKETPDFYKVLHSTLQRLNPGKDISTVVGDVGNKIPASYTAENPSITAEEALKWRQQLDKEIPPGYWRNPQGVSDEVRAKVAIRNALGSAVHEYAPGTVKPDKLLSTYAKIGSDIPSLAKKALGAVVLDRIGKGVGGPVGESTADIYTIMKMLGHL